MEVPVRGQELVAQRQMHLDTADLDRVDVDADEPRQPAASKLDERLEVEGHYFLPAACAT
jgi:hypothetical protein